MKIFDGVEDFFTKVNFVDKNNVILGYDMGQDCCEYADWHISDREDIPISVCIDEMKLNKELDEEEKWIFDTSFHKSNSHPSLDEGGIATFRIINGNKIKYIHLFNYHNGYYSHGFKFETEQGVILESYL